MPARYSRAGTCGGGRRSVVERGLRRHRAYPGPDAAFTRRRRRRDGASADCSPGRRSGASGAARDPLAGRACRQSGPCSRCGARPRARRGDRRQSDARVLPGAQTRVAARPRAGGTGPHRPGAPVACVRGHAADGRSGLRRVNRHVVLASLRCTNACLVARGGARGRRELRRLAEHRPGARRARGGHARGGRPHGAVRGRAGGGRTTRAKRA